MNSLNQKVNKKAELEDLVLLNEDLGHSKQLINEVNTTMAEVQDRILSMGKYIRAKDDKCIDLIHKLEV